MSTMTTPPVATPPAAAPAAPRTALLLAGGTALAAAVIVPVLDRLPAPDRSCVLAEIVRAQPRSSPWTSANVARARAADVLDRRPVGACPRSLG